MRRYSRLKLTTLLAVLTTILIALKFQVPYFDEYIQTYSRFSTTNGGHRPYEVVILEDSVPVDAGLMALKIAGKMNHTVLTTDELELLGRKPLHPLSLEEPQKTRKEIRTRNCKNFKNKNRVMDFSRLIYDDNHKVVMCVVPKSACTNWKLFLWYLMGFEKDRKKLYSMNRATLRLDDGSLPNLAQLPREDALKRLSTYTTFFVKRHPLDRLVSAHNNKFTNMTSDVYYKSLGRRIAAKFADETNLHNISIPEKISKETLKVLQKSGKFNRLSQTQQADVIEYIKTLTSGNIAFQEFIKYLASSSGLAHEYFDVHWKPQSLLCNPCAINYDYIVEFNNLTAEGNKLLEYLQREDPVESRILFKTDREPSRINTDRTKLAFQDISDELLTIIKDIYHEDFLYLNYEDSIS